MTDLEFEEIIFQNLIFNEEYIRNVSPYLDESYFGQFHHQLIRGLIIDYFNKFNKPPTMAALRIELDNKDNLAEDHYERCSETLERISEYVSVDHDWLVEKTEKFCQDKAIYNAIMESIRILDKKSDKDKGTIPEMLQTALGVSFDSNIGHDFLEDGEKRFDLYRLEEDRLPFDIDFFNTITKGGLLKKTLNVILASTGVGKSLIMCHFAGANLMMGKNVLYLTMEMAEERIAQRLDAHLMNLTLNELDETVDKEIFVKKLDRIRNKTQGKLIVKEYPTSSVGAGHFRHLLNELKTKKKFVPDVIYVDYINLCISSRVRMGGSVNTYTYIKSIAEELRGLAVEFNVPIVTATQSNRDASRNSDVDLADTSESWGLPATVDFMVAAINSEEYEALGQLQIKQLKNRYNDPTLHRRFLVGVDRSRMKLYNLEKSAQEGLSKDLVQGEDVPVMDNSRFGDGLRAEKGWGRDTFESWK